MTSKSLYFSLLKEDIRRRVWAMALSVLAFFCIIPINILLEMDRLKNDIKVLGLTMVQDTVASYVNTKSGVIIFITVVIAVLSAFSGFMYLYAKDKVDLYHSIPVRREKLFITTYISGFLIFIIPYAINLILFFVVAASSGLVNGETIRGAVMAMLLNSVGFLLIYNTIIAAVMLTGNMLTGVMATGVFMGFMPVFALTISAMQSEFFKTYSGYGSNSDQLSKISPAYGYFNIFEKYNMEEPVLKTILIIIVCIVLIFAASLFLYKKRPSEAAGRAMAFKISELPVKFIIVVLSSLLGGLCFMSMNYSNGFIWFVFGIIFIGALSHAVMEIIYTADFRSAVANKLQFAGIMLVSLVISLIFKFDIFKYDAYIPNQNNIASMAVSFNNIDNYMYTYERDSSGFERYVSADEFIMDNMKIENTESAYKLADYAKSNNINRKEGADSNRRWVNTIVKYVLKNGKEVYRSYMVYEDEASGLIGEVYNDLQYKEGSIPLLANDEALIESIGYYDAYDGEATTTKEPDKVNKLLELYLEDMKRLKYDEAKTELPVAMLSFECVNRDYNRSYSNVYDYYVYGSFTNTIEYMKSLGAELKTGFDTEQIKSITIETADENYDNYSYNSYGTAEAQAESALEGGIHVFEDKADIEKICKAMINDEFTYNLAQSYNNFRNVQVEYKDGRETNSSRRRGFIVNIDKLDQSIKDKLGVK